MVPISGNFRVISTFFGHHESPRNDSFPAKCCHSVATAESTVPPLPERPMRGVKKIRDQVKSPLHAGCRTLPEALVHTWNTATRAKRPRNAGSRANQESCVAAGRVLSARRRQVDNLRCPLDDRHTDLDSAALRAGAEVDTSTLTRPVPFAMMAVLARWSSRSNREASRN
jgi:hypothetical protein